LLLLVRKNYMTDAINITNTNTDLTKDILTNIPILIIARVDFPSLDWVPLPPVLHKNFIVITDNAIDLNLLTDPTEMKTILVDMSLQQLSERQPPDLLPINMPNTFLKTIHMQRPMMITVGVRSRLDWQQPPLRVLQQNITMTVTKIAPALLLHHQLHRVRAVIQCGRRLLL
jgi:hypothetical protein